ncbi:MAG TPA: hypothetical protein VKZ53_15780 [Candidatus Angelobacter sp.]|nr:hypothetical protein [Candidatus Angelobacter sp.]
MPPAENLREPSMAIAFPLRLDRGLLRKVDQQDAVMTVIGIMARTPSGTWSGSSSFGFSDRFQELSNRKLTPEARKKLSEQILGGINQALKELGVSGYEAIALEEENREDEKPGQKDGVDMHAAIVTPVFFLKIRSLSAAGVLEMTL